jgi:hypothetical protein
VKYDIDTVESNCTGYLIAVDKSGRHHRLLGLAICQSVCVTIESRFHYFKTKGDDCIVRFDIPRKAKEGEPTLETRLELSQAWLSAEMSRLGALQDDLDTLAKARANQ